MTKSAWSLLRLYATLSQIYPHWNWNSKLNTKLRLVLQFEYGFKSEFQVEWLIRRESVECKSDYSQEELSSELISNEIHVTYI